MDLNFNLTPTEGQLQAFNLLHDKEVKIMVLLWSRQCGKSLFAEMACIEYLCKPYTFNAYITPNFSLAKKVFSEISNALQYSNIITKKNMNDLRIETIFGSVLQFFSAESPISIRGNTVSGILVLDEAAFFPEVTPNGDSLFYSVIQPITKVKCKKILMISTPNRRSGFFFDYYQRGLANESGIRALKRNIYDDQLVTEEYIEELKRNIPEKYFRMEYLADFVDDLNSFFYGFEKQFTLDNYDDSLKCWCGIDLSADGSDATILTLLNGKDEVKQFEIVGDLDNKYRQIAKIINDLDKKGLLQRTLIEVNGLGKAMFNEIKKLVRCRLNEFTTTNSSKEEIISELAVEINKGNIFFQKGDYKLYNELANFVVSLTKAKKLKFEGNHTHDDRVMSLAFALRAKQMGIKGTLGNILRV